jgi:heat-inducible transcriptional repressor
VELTLRKEKILSSVVTEFLKSGEPVGSKVIAEEIGVSSATVRNEMSGLTEMGLLEQPHTSAGRVPSQKGYREFVDRLMEVPSLTPEEKRLIDAKLAPVLYDTEQLLVRTVELAASISRCAAAVTTPGGAGARVRAIQLVQTSRRTAMLLMMSSTGTMKNRIFRCDYDLTTDILRVFFRAFNERIAGKKVSDITPAFLQSLGASLGEMYALVGAPLRALLEAAHDTARTETLLGGQMNLLFYPEIEPRNARNILGLLENKEEFSMLLRQKPGKVTTMIGRECGRPELDTVSMMVSRYTIDRQDAGAVAVVGPVRMDYPRLTAVLEYLTDTLSAQLTQLTGED